MGGEDGELPQHVVGSDKAGLGIGGLQLEALHLVTEAPEDEHGGIADAVQRVFIGDVREGALAGHGTK